MGLNPSLAHASMLTLGVRRYETYWATGILRMSGSSSSITVANCPSETPSEDDRLFAYLLEGSKRLTAIEQNALGILSSCASVLFQDVLSFSQPCARLGTLEDTLYS